MQISVLDWLVIGEYLVALALIGVVASMRVKGTGHYFLGGRHFGKLLMIAQSFGVGTHADMPVSLTGAVYSNGISAVWFQWKNLFAMPFYWIMAPVFRRVRRATTAEVMADRYGSAMAWLYVVFSFAFFIINIASILKGAAKILNMILGGQMGVNAIVLALAAIFIFYSFIGGLTASAWSDCVQGVLIIVLSFLLIPLGWGMVGGMARLRETLPAAKLSLATPKEISVWFITVLTINGMVGIMAQPHVMASVGTGKNEYACRTGLLYGNFIKRICTVGWAFIGLMVAVMIKRALFGVSSLGDSEDAFGFACGHLLTSGLRGLLVAGVMGAGLASCSALMIDSGALFTQGVYRRIRSQALPDRHYLWVGRWSGLAVVAVAVVYSLLFVQKVLYSFLLTETMAAYIGIAVVSGLIWKRANRWGALSSVAGALTANFLLYSLKHERLDYWDPNVFLVSLLTGTACMIFVSLATPAEPNDRVQPFFQQLATPSDLTAEEDAARSAMAAEDARRAGSDASVLAGPSRWDAEHGRQLLIVNLLQPRRGACGVGFTRAYAQDLRGLMIGVALCAGLVSGLWMLLHV